MVLDFVHGAARLYGHGVAHSDLGVHEELWQTIGSDGPLDMRASWFSRAPRPRSSSAEFAAMHRQMATSFCTIDLTKVDPGALCRTRRGSCMVRNAVCDSEPQDGKQPTYHCLCRPGSCATISGICVQEQCTSDSTGGAAGAAAKKQAKLDAEAPTAEETKGQEVADRKQADMAAPFAGSRGIMPNVSIPGGGGGDTGDDVDGDYKIKFLLPNASSVGGSNGPVQVGSQDFDPAIIDGLGILTNKLEKAQQLNATAGDGWDEAPSGASMPGAALVAAYLAPKWASPCGASDGQRRQPHLAARWAAFLSPAA